MRKIPVLGHGMDFFSWIFLNRNWESDKVELERSIDRLSHSEKQKPMWLLLFPEGTNLSKRSLAISSKWAEKHGLPQSDLILLPRTRGLRVCLERLAGSVDWLYDCTMAYEGLPYVYPIISLRQQRLLTTLHRRGVDGQDIVNLRSLYVKGEKAPLTHAHYRRFAVREIPLHDSEAFDAWLYERWAEKEKLLAHFQMHDRFPAEEGYHLTCIRLRSRLEVLIVLFTCGFAILVTWVTARSLYFGIIGICARITLTQQ
jgi:lysocardiolipin and lysophospholipid acyltransferase